MTLYCDGREEACWKQIRAREQLSSVGDTSHTLLPCPSVTGTI